MKIKRKKIKEKKLKKKIKNKFMQSSPQTQLRLMKVEPFLHSPRTEVLKSGILHFGQLLLPGLPLQEFHHYQGKCQIYFDQVLKFPVQLFSSLLWSTFHRFQKVRYLQ